MKRTLHVGLMLVLLGVTAVSMMTTGCALNGFREIILALNLIPAEIGDPVTGSLRVINDLLQLSTLLPKPTAVATTGTKLGVITGIAADVFNGTYVSDLGDPDALADFVAGDDPINGRLIAVDVLGAATTLNVTGLIMPTNVHVGIDGNSLVYFDTVVNGDDDRSPDRAADDEDDDTGLFSTPIGAAGLLGATRTRLYNGADFVTPADFDVELLGLGSFLVSDPGFGDDPDTAENETTGAILRVSGTTVTTVHSGESVADFVAEAGKIRDGAYGSVVTDAIGTIAVVNIGVDADGMLILQILSIPASGAATTLFEQTVEATALADAAAGDFVVSGLGQIEFGALGNILAIRTGTIKGDATADPVVEDEAAFQVISITGGTATNVTAPEDITGNFSGGFALR